MTAAEPLDMAASLLNDTAKTSFTYAAMIPYLNMALRELQELFEENNIPSTNEISAVLSVPAGTTVIAVGGTPALPADLIEPQWVGERSSGSSDTFVKMDPLDFLPTYPTTVTWFRNYSWRENTIIVPAANGIREIQIRYIKSLFTTITASTDTITVTNGTSFLGYRTGGLCAQFIGENETRANELNADAVLALARTLNIGTKGRQGMAVRRRPFMSSSRGYYR